MYRKRLSKNVILGCCVGLLWLYHLAFPLYRLHDGQVVRKSILFPPVERLQWRQVPAMNRSHATKLFPDSISGDNEMVDYRPPPFWINSGVGAHDRLGRSGRNVSLIIAIWGTIFWGFFAGGKLTRTEARRIRNYSGSQGTD